MKTDSLARLSNAVELYNANRRLDGRPKLNLFKCKITKTLDEHIKAAPHLTVSLLYLDLDNYEPE